MLQVYYADINLFDLDFLIDYIDLISEERQARVNQLRFAEDKKRGIIGELLLLYSLVIDFSKDVQDIIIKRDYFGKPYIMTEQNIEFNLSHSGRYAVCAVSDRYVGIDVQECGSFYEGVAVYLHPKEQMRLKMVSADSRNRYLYDLWCSKESYVKCLGLGLRKSLSSFDVELSLGKEGGTIWEKNQKKFSGYLDKVHLSSGYSCFVCHYSESINKVKEVKQEDLLRLISRCHFKSL